MGKKRTCSAMSVQVKEQSGLDLECTTKDRVEEAIFREVHDKRYAMAKEAPICNRKIFDKFGYMANTAHPGQYSMGLIKHQQIQTW